jgi:DNA repair protein RecN (Recombination protein N)
MLTQLFIENFAIIEKCSLEFNQGMTVITGETGAGKSIILDALSLVLGARAENQPVRKDAHKCEIQAVFDLQSYPNIQTWLKEKDLVQDDTPECFLKRTLLAEGRSRSFINHNPVPLQLLRELGEMLVTLHGQHEHQALMSRETHRLWVDSYAHHAELLIQLQTIYQHYKEVEKQLSAYQSQTQDKESRKEFLQYQLQELQQINIESFTAEKIKQLEQDYKSISNIKNHADNYETILDIIDNTLLPALHKAQNLLPKTNDTVFHQYFETTDIQLNQIIHEIRSITEKSETHPEKIAALEKQLDLLYHLSRKHHVKPAELPEQMQKLQLELEQLESLSNSIDSLTATLNTLKQSYLTLGEKLSHSRKKSGKKMSEEIERYLRELNMEHAKFSVSLIPYNDNNPLHQHGLEKIEFLVSPNPGQPLEPLTKIASGGELSRISLAIDLIAVKDQILPVLIFDEVDAGISGSAALKVGKLLKTLSRKAQVICITHLPQIASKADHHIFVEKTIDTKHHKTNSKINYLDTEQKIQMIAKLIGGDKLTEKALSHARELIES